MFEAGYTVISRNGKSKGKTTGAHYRCTMDGCTGQRVVVRWRGGKTTRPCSKGMILSSSAKTWKII